MVVFMRMYVCANVCEEKKIKGKRNIARPFHIKIKTKSFREGKRGLLLVKESFYLRWVREKYR